VAGAHPVGVLDRAGLVTVLLGAEREIRDLPGCRAW
jgi:hypothetical protein